MANRWTLDGDGTIEIQRDEHGVAHVRAAHEADLYRGLGHCHAVDRGLAMLLMRILARGRASELIDASDEMLDVDRFFRRMNFGGEAAVEADKLSVLDRRRAEAYCDGVNHALRRRTPWELRILGYRPEPWTVADSVLISRMMGYVSLAQSQGDMERLFIEMVQAGVPEANLHELFPNVLDGLDYDLLRKVHLGERFVPEAVRWSKLLPHALASNCWAVAPDKTRSGHSILASDSHLEVNRLPAIWYEAVLELGDRFCIAGTIPGLPGLVVGRTNDVAWGLTYSYVDAIDTWVEDCREGCYRRNIDGEERWLPFRVRREVIRRKKQPAVTVDFHENEHGVLEGDPSVPGLYLATRWSVSGGTGAASISAAFGLLHAPDAATAMSLVGRIETAWNFILADSAGNIGYQMSGLVPIRGTGRPEFVPLPGWEPTNDWKGFVPAKDLPSTLNPETGFVANANDDLSRYGTLRPINLPTSPYRAERIHQLLTERDDWGPEDFERLQLDLLSPQAERFMEVLRPLLPATPTGETLRAWDCCYDLDSQGAYLFEEFYRELIVEVFGSICGEDVVRFLLEETPIVTAYYYNFDQVLLSPESSWFGGEGRDTVFRRVAQRALGGPIHSWGSQRQLLMKHLVLGGRLPRLLGFDHGPVPLAGGRATLRQCQIYRSGGREQTFAPSYRFISDFGERSARTAIAGGPSDRRFSRWYTAGIDDWVDGRYKRLHPRP